MSDRDGILDIHGKCRREREELQAKLAEANDRAEAANAQLRDACRELVIHRAEMAVVAAAKTWRASIASRGTVYALATPAADLISAIDVAIDALSAAEQSDPDDELSASDFGTVTQSDLDAVAYISGGGIKSKDVSVKLDDEGDPGPVSGRAGGEDAADGEAAADEQADLIADLNKANQTLTRQLLQLETQRDRVLALCDKHAEDSDGWCAPAHLIRAIYADSREAPTNPQAREQATAELREANRTIVRQQDNLRAAEHHWKQTLGWYHSELDQTRNLLADTVIKATEYGTQDGDFVASYILPTGPIHRAIPFLDQRGINVRPGFDGRSDEAPTGCRCPWDIIEGRRLSPEPDCPLHAADSGAGQAGGEVADA